MNENAPRVCFLKTNNIVHLMIQGETKPRKEDDLLFTLPEGYRPLVTCYITCTFGSRAYGVIAIKPDGICAIYLINEETTARIFASGWFYLN